MNKKLTFACRSIALGALLAGASGASHACSSEAYLSTVCIMATPGTNWQGLLPANGAILNTSANMALFSLIGATYGGNGSSTFALPDTRGRFIIGAGNGYTVGATGGLAQVQLSQAHLPAHSHTITSASVSGMSATLNLSTATASAVLSGVTFSAAGSSLTLRGFNGSGTQSTPGGGALATSVLPASRVYAASAPNVDMIAGSIGGTISGTLSGTAPVTLSGSTPVGISGTISGSTSIAGSSTAVPILPPYLALNYFVVVNGYYPTSN